MNKCVASFQRIYYNIIIGGNIMIDKKILEKEYIKNEKSMNEIASEYNISVGTVYNYIKKYRNKIKKSNN